MDRAEQAGLGIAVAAHAALFAALSLNLLKPPALPDLRTDPIQVSIVDQVALQSSAPSPAAAPAPAQTSSPETDEAPPVPPPPAAEPAPQPKQVPKPVPAKPAAAPAKPVLKHAEAPRKPGLSRDLVAGLSDAPSPRGTATPTDKTKASGIGPAQMTGAQKASLNSLIYTQLKPYWKPPSGADAELLVTLLRVKLNKDGSLATDPEVIGQRGLTESNRTQAKIHAERAIQAVRRAAPFHLPPEYYEAWKWLEPLKLYVGQPG